MRPGVCMECGIEFCRVNEQHTAIDCINNLKNLLGEYKRVVEPLKEEVEYLSRLGTRTSKLEIALIRARDQLALYKADYSVARCNEALNDEPKNN